MSDLKSLPLLPPAPGRCQVCAVEHEPAEPHDPGSMYYQVAFAQEHGRAPTWSDALAHCSDEVRRAWIEALAEHGVAVE